MGNKRLACSGVQAVAAGNWEISRKIWRDCSSVMSFCSWSQLGSVSAMIERQLNLFGRPATEAFRPDASRLGFPEHGHVNDHVRQAGVSRVLAAQRFQQDAGLYLGRVLESLRPGDDGRSRENQARVGAVTRKGNAERA